MTGQTKPSTPDHTRSWNVRLDLFEDDKEGDTTAHVVLDTGDNRLDRWASAHCHPGERLVPEIGDEYAAGRALREMGQRLMDLGALDAEENAHGRSDHPRGR
ncbi:dsRBD fold-containing protein [Actinacidiphila sp. bgisy145]|uniref:dsRBD fold-containing protein n=1 Tax=Actinacidiphila sp. bgisy145 TaxID=3413792 RepID=UPI003EB7CEFE